MQAGHQAVLKTFEKQGAKVFKRDSSTAERRPQNPASAPHISLLIQSPGSALDEHVGREHECFQRIALLSQRIPANEIVLLCQTQDLAVKAMFETICPSLSSTPMLTHSRITLYPVQPSEYYPASGHRG